MYKHLLKRIEHRLPDHIYYEVLLEHSSDIITRINKIGQKLVASELNMSQSKLSILSKLLGVLELPRQYYVYYVVISGNSVSKIGQTINLAKRLSALNEILIINADDTYKVKPSNCKDKHADFETIKSWEFNTKEEALSAEMLIKQKYKHLTVEGYTEIFKGSPLTDLDFNLLDKLAIEV